MDHGGGYTDNAMDISVRDNNPQRWFMISQLADQRPGAERVQAAQRESLHQAEHLFQSLLQRAFAEGA